MDAVDRFAVEATLFRTWMREGTDEAERFPRAALVHLTRLYLAALDLPPAWSEELADQPDAEGISDEECQAVAAVRSRLPFDLYNEVFEPCRFPPEQPVVGSLLDDLLDIYRDVVGGLEEYQAGRRAQALWEWSFQFQSHWGEHATGAIRALHSWLATNAPGRFAVEG